MQAASEAYDATLAPVHTYFVRTAVKASLYLLPDRATFLQSIGETGLHPLLSADHASMHSIPCTFRVSPAAASCRALLKLYFFYMREVCGKDESTDVHRQAVLHVSQMLTFPLWPAEETAKVRAAGFAPKAGIFVERVMHLYDGTRHACLRCPLPAVCILDRLERRPGGARGGGAALLMGQG